MNNKYGNFVLSKAVNESTMDQTALLQKSIGRNLNRVTIAKYRSKWQLYIKKVRNNPENMR